MEIANTTIDFNEMLEEIEEDEILLPDFQRKFSWTTKELQKKLAASVLCKMPIGSILLLELPATEYAARRIGTNGTEDFIMPDTADNRQFLLDGQQRVTVMVNLFSNLIHEKKATRIDTLKRRCFLGIPKQTDGTEQRDEWGLSRLIFPLADPQKDIPNFLTSDIADTVFLEDFTQKKNVPYNPYMLCRDEDLMAYCISNPSNPDYYFIPLYLLAKRTDETIKRRNRRLLQSILQEIAKSQGNHLLTAYEELSGEERREWLESLLVEEKKIAAILADGVQLDDEIEKVREEIAERIQNWQDDMEEYLYSCLEKMNLHIMGVPNSRREKAIEVFENMNRGGVKLSTFDLMMARAARSNHSFANDLERECKKERTYPISNVPDRIRSYCVKYMESKKTETGSFNALTDMKCLDAKDDYSKIFQDTFLNVLSLRCHDGKGSSNRNYREEMSREKILNLSSEEINANYEKCCDALDRAAFFLKARCGIRCITEVNYQLMYTVLSYLFLNEEIYKKEKVWNLLTAWYWSVIFSGGYDKNQNMQAVRDIIHLSQIVKEEKDSTHYIEELHKQTWLATNFSDKDFLLYRKSEIIGDYPKEILGHYICQFYLSQGYMDLFDDKVFLCTFPVDDTAIVLEKHHIIPKMSFQNIREEEKWLKSKAGEGSVVNSPINMVYITAKSNKDISSKDFASYLRYLKSDSLSALDLPNKLDETQQDNIVEILEERFQKIKGNLDNFIKPIIAS